MKLRNALLVGSFLALPVAAMAQPVDGIYIGGGLGGDYVNTLNGKRLVLPLGSDRGAKTVPVNSANLQSNGGFVGLASIGYGLGNGIRFEVEGNYRQNHVHVSNSATASNGAQVNGGGNYQQYGVMANAFFDFDVGAGWVYPYVGAGVGYIENAFQGGNLYSTDPLTRDPISIGFTSSAKGSAAAQGILGASFPIDYALSLTTEFRFVGEFSQQTYNGHVNFNGQQYAPGTSLKLSAPTNESLLIGLRYAFNATPPAPPPAPAPVAAPAPAPARTYLVFFDWDKADLTARAKQIIAEAAANVAKVQVTRIEVNGYTDLSGTTAYNQKLSVRRADAVKAELIKNGVPANEIFAQGFGESNPLVPTARGVREPQNRRVEIILK